MVSADMSQAQTDCRLFFFLYHDQVLLLVGNWGCDWTWKGRNNGVDTGVIFFRVLIPLLVTRAPRWPGASHSPAKRQKITPVLQAMSPPAEKVQLCNPPPVERVHIV